MIRELLSILWDVIVGSRCQTCFERHGDLSAHMTRSPECGGDR